MQHQPKLCKCSNACPRLLPPFRAMSRYGELWSCNPIRKAGCCSGRNTPSICREWGTLGDAASICRRRSKGFDGLSSSNLLHSRIDVSLCMRLRTRSIPCNHRGRRGQQSRFLLPFFRLSLQITPPWFDFAERRAHCRRAIAGLGGIRGYENVPVCFVPAVAR